MPASVTGMISKKFDFAFSIPQRVSRPIKRVNNTLSEVKSSVCDNMKSKGNSDNRAKSKRFPAYFNLFLVCRKPCTSKKQKRGKEIRPINRSTWSMFNKVFLVSRERFADIIRYSKIPAPMWSINIVAIAVSFSMSVENVLVLVFQRFWETAVIIIISHSCQYK